MNVRAVVFLAFVLAVSLFAFDASAEVTSCVDAVDCTKQLLNLDREVPQPNFRGISNFAALACVFLILVYLIRFGVGMARNDDFSLARLVTEWVCFMVLLLSYPAVSNLVFQGAQSLGTLSPGEAAGTGISVLRARYDKFSDQTQKSLDAAKRELVAPREDSEGQNFLDRAFDSARNAALAPVRAQATLLKSGVDLVVQSAINTLAMLSFGIATAVVYFLSALQTVILAVLRYVGPLVIVLAAIPVGAFRGLLWGWLMFIIEVSLWGFVSKMFVTLTDQTYNNMLRSDAGVGFSDILFCVFYALGFLMIPVVCSMLVRGGSAGGIASKAMSTATSAISAGLGMTAGAALNSSAASSVLGRSGSASSGKGKAGAGAATGASKNWGKIAEINKHRGKSDD